MPPRRKKRSNGSTSSSILSMNCPPKTFCINKMSLAFFTIVAILSMLVYRTVFRHSSVYYRGEAKQASRNESSFSLPTFLQAPNLHMPSLPTSRDVYKDVYTPPLKPNWSLHNMDSYKMPVNISTSHQSRPYRQVGILSREDPSDNQRERETILALFGRPIHASRSKWQYYTMTDKSAGIKLPMTIKGKSANSTYGCDELFTNDTVHVKGYGEHFKVTIYDTEMLEYQA